METIKIKIEKKRRGRPPKSMSASVQPLNLNKRAIAVMASQSFSKAPILKDTSLCPPTRLVKTERIVQPFKTASEVEQIVRHLFATCQWREYMLIVVGINTGLRYSDLSTLRFSDFMDQDGIFYERIDLLEKKTQKSHKTNRHIYINEAVRQAISIYLAHHPKHLNDLLFESISNNRTLYNQESKPLCRSSFGDIIQKAAREAGLSGSYNTHTLRKTFGCNFLRAHKDDPHAIYTLQMIYGHSSPSITLRYIGITEDDIKNSYLELNLGSLSSIAAGTRGQKSSLENSGE